MKKTIAILLVAVMALSLTAAFAGSPVDYVEKVETKNNTTTNNNNAAPAAPVAAEPVVTVEENALTKSILAAVETLTKAGGSVVSYFPADIQAALPADAKLNELVALNVANAPAGDLQVEITFTTEFTDDEQVFAVIGLADAAGNVTWVLVECEVQANGALLITIPADVAAKMASAASVVLAVLSAPKAA